MPTETPCLLVDRPGQVRVATCQTPGPTGDELLIEVECSGISPGTELREMRLYDPKSSRPFVPGYATGGRVVDAGPDAKRWVGRRVFLAGSRCVSPHLKRWGGHVALAVAEASSAVALPDQVDACEASMAKVAAIALHGVRTAGVTEADRVVVVGLGVIGQCVARLAAAEGASVWAIDTSASRVRAAREAGIEAHVADRDSPERLRDLTGGGGDAVFDSTGVPGVLASSVALLRSTPWGEAGAVGPRLVIQGSYQGEFALPYQALFEREARVLIPRDTLHGDLVGVMDRLADGTLRLADLVSEVVPPDGANDFYARLAQDPAVLAGAIRWRPSTPRHATPG